MTPFPILFMSQPSMAAIFPSLSMSQPSLAAPKIYLNLTII